MALENESMRNKEKMKSLENKLQKQIMDLEIESMRNKFKITTLEVKLAKKDIELKTSRKEAKRLQRKIDKLEKDELPKVQSESLNVSYFPLFYLNACVALCCIDYATLCNRIGQTAMCCCRLPGRVWCVLNVVSNTV